MISAFSCADYAQRLSEGAKRQGEARVNDFGNLPPMPAECWRGTPHAAVHEGQEGVVSHRAERKQLDKANNLALACSGPGGFYDDLRTGSPK